MQAAGGSRVMALRASPEAAESSRQAAVRERLSQEWELDCYSRPVIGEDGKKLWELLITDSLGEFKAVETMPSNMVNSREVRKLVEKVCCVQYGVCWKEGGGCLSDPVRVTGASGLYKSRPACSPPVHQLPNSSSAGDRGGAREAARDPVLPERHVQHGLARAEGPQGPRGALPLHQRPLQLARPAVRACVHACIRPRAHGPATATATFMFHPHTPRLTPHVDATPTTQQNTKNDREQEVYSQMAGYDPTMRDSSDVFGLREPEIMPDGLMGDKVRILWDLVRYWAFYGFRATTTTTGVDCDRGWVGVS